MGDDFPSVLRGSHDGAKKKKSKKTPKTKQLCLRGFMYSLANSVATALNVLLACDYISSDNPFVTRCFNAVLSELSFRLRSFKEKGVFSLIKSFVV